jgi:hypothetical protein
MDEMRLRVRYIAARCEETVSSARRQIKLSTELLDEFDQRERYGNERAAARAQRRILRASMIKAIRLRGEQ